jgi:cytochrome P450
VTVRAAASEDYALRGQKIKKGDSLILITPSANRDEDVFNEPFRFAIKRDPNPHLAFGVGEHFCLGAARFEIEVIFRALFKHIEDVEYTGPLEPLRSNFVGGIKRMTVRLSFVRIRCDASIAKSPRAVRAPRETEGIAPPRRIQRCASE